MTAESKAHPRRWAPEWIAVLTLAVAIVGLGGGMFTSLNAMEARLRADMQVIREDMRAMESRLREDMRTIELRLREDMRTIEFRLREDMHETRGEVGGLRDRVAGLEQRES